MPKLRNGHVPVADLSSYQHSEPRHKLPRAFTTELSDIRKESVVLFFFFFFNFITAELQFSLRQSEAIQVIEFHQNQIHRDLFMKVLFCSIFCSIHWEQYDGQVHLFRKKGGNCSEILFPRLKVWGELGKVWEIWFRHSCVTAKSQSCLIKQTERGLQFLFQNTWQHY